MNIATNRVGQTSLRVTELSFGGSAIGNMGRMVSDAKAQALLCHAWSKGLRYFDTAPHYGRGRSEQRMGDFLRSVDRDAIVVSSKVGRVLRPGQRLEQTDGFLDPLPNSVHYDYSADGIYESFEASCERLGTSRIDIIYCHDIGAYTHGAAAAEHMDTFLGSGVGALQALKTAGKISAWGLGVNECEACLEVMANVQLDVILLAGRLTLLDRSAEQALVGCCADMGTSLVLGGIFNSGILATGPVTGAWFDYQPAEQAVLDKVSQLQKQARAVGLSLPEAAMQFAMRHPASCSVLIGTGKISSLDRNLTAAWLELGENAVEFVTT